MHEQQSVRPACEPACNSDQVRRDTHPASLCPQLTSNEYSPEFSREQWSYLSTGVMIQFANHGLVHYTEPDEDLEFLGRAAFAR
jgi:hypothetical protein